MLILAFTSDIISITSLPPVHHSVKADSYMKCTTFMMSKRNFKTGQVTSKTISTNLHKELFQDSWTSQTCLNHVFWLTNSHQQDIWITQIFSNNGYIYVGCTFDESLPLIKSSEWSWQSFWLRCCCHVIQLAGWDLAILLSRLDTQLRVWITKYKTKTFECEFRTQ